MGRTAALSPPLRFVLLMMTPSGQPFRRARSQLDVDKDMNARLKLQMLLPTPSGQPFRCAWRQHDQRKPNLFRHQSPPASQFFCELAHEHAPLISSSGLGQALEKLFQLRFMRILPESSGRRRLLHQSSNFTSHGSESVKATFFVWQSKICI